MLIAGNWKMNTDAATASELARDVLAAIGDAGDVQVALCPPFVHLGTVGSVVQGTPLRLGAQNMHSEEKGAFTGEISAPMLASVGCHYVILGHSERRQQYGETNALVNAKVRQALAHGLSPIVCVGESLSDRKAGRQNKVVGSQVLEALAGVRDVARLVIAYEPVWAIGTGRTATPQEADKMHAWIRSLLSRMWQGTVAKRVPLLYGGSMKPSNALDLLRQWDVDGGLIGGASLMADSFAAIVRAGQKAVATAF